MNLEQLQQDPSLLLPNLLLSLVITLAAYCAFPLIFAAKRIDEISKTKYRVICFAVNLLVMILFALSSGAANAAPYVLWTWVFSSIGIRIMENNGIFYDGSDSEESEEAEKYEEVCAGAITADGWQCTCGRTYPKYVSSCTCGKNKTDIMNPENSAP